MDGVIGDRGLEEGDDRSASFIVAIWDTSLAARGDIVRTTWSVLGLVTRLPLLWMAFRRESFAKVSSCRERPED
jgi:hypothetical protein